MKLPASRAVVCLFVVLAVSAAIGGLWGSPAQARSDEAEINAKLLTFMNVLDLVEANYATQVTSDKAVYGAIDGMLRTLDPHSKFFDPAAYRSLREDQSGKYYGLGITVTTRFDEVTVVSPPFPKSPAEKAGLRVGDVITLVNETPTKGLELNEVVGKLKGPRGTTVKIQVRRPGVTTPLELEVMRDEIEKYTVNQKFMLKPGIGYIKLDSFAETSGKELRDALKALDSKNFDALVLDLRGNPGGLLQEAIKVSETFLDRGQLILKTSGRVRGSAQDYSAQMPNPETKFPIIVLINKSSASASEIVSGAIQDHDRGLIVGETSFGKGLVQSVYQLGKRDAGPGLALTTQKWYTPSGRLIQRDYSQTSLFNYYNHLDNPELHKTDDIKKSDHGRLVYGGGGITPDHIVAEFKMNPFQESLTASFGVFTYVHQKFLVESPATDASFRPSEAILADFKRFLRSPNTATPIPGPGLKFTDKDFADNIDFIAVRFRQEVLYSGGFLQDAARVALEIDPQVQKAIEYIPEAKALRGQMRNIAAEPAAPAPAATVPQAAAR